VVHQARAPGEPPTRVVNVIDGRPKALALGNSRTVQLILRNSRDRWRSDDNRACGTLAMCGACCSLAGRADHEPHVSAATPPA
jgi:hypothetical protein